MIEALDGPDPPPAHPSLSYWSKLLYGVGEIANAVKVVTFGLYAIFFATVVLRLPGTWIGVIGFTAMVWDALIDPYIGYLTDDVLGRSRRHIVMLIGALAMGPGFWAFFSPPHGLSGTMLLVWMFVASFVVRTATSMYSIPYYALGVTLSTDYHERTSITAIRGITSIIGTSLVASLSFVLFFREKVPGVDPKLQGSGYASMGAALGILMTSVALIAAFSSMPLQRRAASTPSPRTKHNLGTLFRTLWDSLRNPSFGIVLMSFSLLVSGLSFITALLLHYLTYYVKITSSSAISSAQGAFYGGGLLGTLFWLQVFRHYEKQRLYIFSAVATAVIMLAAFPLFGRGHLFGTGDIRPLLVVYGLAGFFNCILWFIPQSMLADVADEGELVTGIRREGVLFGMLSFSQQVAAGMAIMLAGVLVDWFVRLVPGQPQQSESTVYRIGLIYSLVPAVLFMASAILMLRYRLTRSRVIVIQAELRQRRTEEAAAAAV